jgi:predicted nucleic acid-binding protein
LSSDRERPASAIARAWLDQALTQAASGATFSVMPMVTASFLRLVTSPKFFQHPAPMADAVSFVDALLAATGGQQAVAGAEWSRMRSPCLERQLSGSDLPDAWLAACVMRLGEHLVNFDRDFRGLLPEAQLTSLTVKP